MKKGKKLYITYFLHKKLSAKGNKTRAVDCSPIRAAASAVSPSLSPAVLNRKEKDEMEKGTRKTEVETRRLGAGKNGYGQVAIEYGPRPQRNLQNWDCKHWSLQYCHWPHIS